MDVIEAEVVSYYERTVAVPEALLSSLRKYVVGQIHEAQQDLNVQARSAERKLTGLQARQQRLLDAYLAGALPIDQFRAKRASLASDIRSAERIIAMKDTRWHDVERTFDQVLYLARHCGEAYRRGSGPDRRRFNQVFFEKLFIDSESMSGAQVADPFRAILGSQYVPAEGERAESENPSQAHGWTELRLAPPTGFEPVLPA